MTIGGLPEMGKTPFWGFPDAVRRQYKFHDLRLHARQAVKVARGVGVPFFVTSEIKGSEASTALLLKLWKTDDASKPLQAFAVSGSPNSVVQSLPRIAKTITARLGVRSPYLIDQMSGRVEDLTYLGVLPQNPRQRLPETVARKLTVISLRVPLANLIFWRSGLLDDDNKKTIISKFMIERAPYNIFMYADIGLQDAIGLRRYNDKFQLLRQKYPHNYMLAATEAKWYQATNSSEQQRRAAELAVKCSPLNVIAWQDLSQSYSDEAGRIRYGRAAKDLTKDEWSILNDLYAKAQQASEKALELNPGFSYSWSQLAETATFASDFELADKALWKAVTLDPSQRDAYNWGFQMYQPKWTDQPEKLLRLAAFMAAHADNCNVPIGSMVASLDAIKRQDKKAELITKCFQRAPQYYEAVYYMGTIAYHDNKQYGDAERYYRKAISLEPDYLPPYKALGKLYFNIKKNYKTAATFLREAIRLEPFDAESYFDLARCLLRQGQRTEAKKLVKQAQMLSGDRTHPIFSELGTN